MIERIHGSALVIVMAALALSAPGRCALAAPSAPDDPEAEARQILETAGVRGGLVVHLGCGDGRLTAALHASDAYLVHGLDTDPARVEAAREAIRRAGLYGPVSVEHLAGDRLPYVDDLVNLVVVSDPGPVPAAEVMRVLAPGGVACVEEGDGWVKTVKPWPKDIDEWTHWLHGPDNNAVSKDRVVGPPRHVQWVAAPRWDRSHDHLATVTGCVWSGGRVFAIVDEGPTAAVVLPARWHLVARDAYNGVLLWKRAIPDWEWRLRGFRSGPSDIARRLVAVGEEVYVTLGYNAPVSALDAATGRTLRTYAGSEGAREIVVHADTLHVVTGGAVPGLPPPDHGPVQERPGLALVRSQRPAYPIRIPAKALAAFDARTGRLLWKKTDAETRDLMPTTLCVAGERVFFENTAAVLCLDARTGRVRWRAERPVARNRPAWSAPTLVAWGKVVISADRDPASTFLPGVRKPAGVLWVVSSRGGMAPPGEMIGFSAEDGRRLWSSPCQECYNAPTDILIADGLIWSGNLVRAGQPGITRGLDPLTGRARRTRPPDGEAFRVGMGHHRCYRNKATERYLVLGRAGVEFIDIRTGRADPNHWVRGACQLGVIPAGGLLYAPPHSCACYIEAKTSGFLALAPASASRRVPGAIPAEGRLEKGPAYAEPIRSPKSEIARDADWPTYRHDGARSGCTPSAAPADLATAWRTALGGRLSSVVVAAGRVYVAQVHAHTVHALDAATGRPVWSFTAGGRVDSPPTVADGRVFFGCRDGWAYCLRAADGRLVWRLRAAPDARRIVAYERLESAWPVHGSVLVRDGTVWLVAGRSAYTDGGLFLYRLGAETGRLLSVTRLSGRDPKTGLERQESIRGTGISGVLPDVLSTDGISVFMRNARFGPEGERLPEDVPHLFSSVGFLDDSWWHRTYWFIGTHIGNGYGGWPNPGNRVPAGRLLVTDGQAVYGFGRNYYIHTGSHVAVDSATVFHYRPDRDASHRRIYYRLFAARRVAAPSVEAGAKSPAKRRAKARGPRYVTAWSETVPVLARAMVLAGRTLLVAGPPDPFASPDPAATLRGEHGGVLLAVAAEDGRVLSRRNLEAPPVFDGMAAARGRLYLATRDGAVLCLGRTGNAP